MDIAHLHFLVAEAEQSERGALIDMLGQMDVARITEVADGLAALRCFHSEFTPAIDVAILDLSLPGMDGLDLIRALGTMQARARVLIVGHETPSIMFSVETLALASGVDLLGTIVKPVTAPLLAALLEHYEDHEQEAHRPPQPGFSFEQIAAGLQARQFEPFFQPKVELETGQVKGLETFARWRHPEHGVLGPGAFMGVLEAHKRVDFLDWTMIERAVQGCRTLLDRGLSMSISINVAPDTLAHPAFIAQVAACVERHRVLPDFITFEMSESSVLDADPAFLERLLRLRMLGYGLAIDDYGTGRSNLQLLARIPFSELKIDRSFVDGAARKRPLSTVLNSCLGLARSLERASVAVGVESEADWDFLQSMGCTFAQGYHIAAPMELGAFPRWLDDWRIFF
jgi:EAL domain-containing protein (putative c-di-GMP-specific phosphodiesterase class I)/CheY-like chemotaxis protein